MGATDRLRPPTGVAGFRGNAGLPDDLLLGDLGPLDVVELIHLDMVMLLEALEQVLDERLGERRHEGLSWEEARERERERVGRTEQSGRGQEENTRHQSGPAEETANIQKSTQEWNILGTHSYWTCLRGPGGVHAFG